MFLSFHIVSTFDIVVIVSVAWVISGLDPSFVKTEPRYLKLDNVSNLCSLTLILLLMPLMLLVISMVFSALVSFPFHADVLSRRLTRLTSSCPTLAKPSISSTTRKCITLLPPMLTVPV